MSFKSMSNATFLFLNKSIKGSMKKIAPFLLRKYSEMSGDKKVKIALSLSDLVRKIYRDGGNNIREYYKIKQSKT